MADISTTLRPLVQRTGGINSLASANSMNAFASAVKADIAEIINQINSVYNPLVSDLAETTLIKPLDLGLAGNTIFTHTLASSGDANVYYDSTLNRARTIKESVDVLLTEMSELRNTFSQSLSSDTYDDSEVRGLITTNNRNLLQLKKDTVGAAYTFDNDGLANRTYPLSQHLDAIGALFTGFPGTGNSYSGSYPALSFSVLLSEVTLDTTIPISTITNLTDYLAYIRSYIGMESVGPKLPQYSDYGTLTYVADDMPLDEALYTLDDAIANAVDLTSHAASHIRAGSDEIDGDQLDIDFTPVAYTPTTTGVAEATHVDHLAAHLKGIDNAIDAIAGGSPFATASNVTSNSPGTLATDDFVFGSDTLANTDSDRQRRFFFDKSKAAFRAGRTQSTQWDDVNVGNHSIALGTDSVASGNYSAALGGQNNVSSSNYSVTLGGTINVANGIRSVVVGGDSNEITSSGERSIIVGGANNEISGTDSVIINGEDNTIDVTCTNVSIISSDDSTIDEVSFASILASDNGLIEDNSTRSALVATNDCTIMNVSSTSVIIASDNCIQSSGANSAIIGGKSCSGGFSHELIHGSFAQGRAPGARAFASGEWIDEQESNAGVGSAQFFESIVHAQHVTTSTGTYLDFRPLLENGSPAAHGYVLQSNRVYNINAAITIIEDDSGEDIVSTYCIQGQIVTYGSTPTSSLQVIGTNPGRVKSTWFYVPSAGFWSMRIDMNALDLKRRAIAHMKVLEFAPGMILVAPT